MLNSEFGNVWGYEGSTGDVDWSWDYHRAIDAFRRHPKLAGWLYTEHHDVINEWNGYWRFDRTWKETGFGEIVDGITLRDLHAPLYIAVGDPELSRTAHPGERIDVRLCVFLSGSTAYGGSLTMRAELYGYNTFGERRTSWLRRQAHRVPAVDVASAAPLPMTMPNERPWRFSLCASRTPRGRAAPQLHNFIIDGDAPATGTSRTAGACAQRVSAGSARRAVVPQAVERARRSKGEWGRERLLRVPHSVAGGARCERHRRRDVPGGGIGQAAQRQGS